MTYYYEEIWVKSWPNVELLYITPTNSHGCIKYTWTKKSKTFGYSMVNLVLLSCKRGLNCVRDHEDSNHLFLKMLKV